MISVRDYFSCWGGECEAGVRVLEKARTRLSSYEDEYVCHAVENAAMDIDTYYATCAAKNIKRAIDDALCHSDGRQSAVVSTWLHREYNIPYEKMAPEKLRQYRMNWIQSMIKELR